MGIIGGRVGYFVLRLISPAGKRLGRPAGNPYKDRSKLDVLFPRAFWDDVVGRTVLDFGCGRGAEAIEMAKRGARRVIGIDIREEMLETARQRALQEGVADQCTFTRQWQEKVDTIVSVDAFEHYDHPDHILRAMNTLLVPDGVVWAVFGPPWYHPYGGHLFSVFPWSHLVFTEASLIRWRADFKKDGARSFADGAGGLNQMTVHRFRSLVSTSAFCLDHLEVIPIRRLRFLSNRLTREFTTSSVRCRLVKDHAAP
jgi:SAM-dependent methyltransferase